MTRTPKSAKVVLLILLLLVIGTVFGFSWMFLRSDMSGPSGYYVKEDDPAVFIEFFDKPKAVSNIMKEYGVREYRFVAYDSEIDLYAPSDIKPHQEWEIYLRENDAIVVGNQRFIKTVKK